MHFKTGDSVIHRGNRKKGRVVEANQYYGWFKVRFNDGTNRIYTSILRKHETTVMLDSSAK